MILFPAIDLKDGACVRLLRGRMSDATVYNTDPAGQARAFVAAGCRWLHIVDLNGAFAGKPVNDEAVRTILAAVDVPVQLGGGIRSLAAIESWLDAGVARVILGTTAISEPQFVRKACQLFPGRIAIGIDARDGKVAVEGWAETTLTEASALARAFENAGVAAIIYTDIERDGALEGPNVAAISAIVRAVTTPVIASGGVSTLADLRSLMAYEADGLLGVVIGRALYDGRLELAEGLRLMAA